MTGRNRRASTSSVETVDENQVLWRQDTSVLRTIPKGSDEDWPEFELRDAIVLGRDGQTLENALHVSTRGPFTVRGTLVVDEVQQKRRLIMKVRESTPIEIRQCTRYSIGEAVDGHPIIWVAGKCGWFELRPASVYLPFYAKICDAVSLYYSLMDRYVTLRPSKSKKSKQLTDELDKTFFKCAVKIGDGSTVEDVRERCLENAAFFISQFAQESPDVITWNSTPFYKWMVDKRGEQVENEEEVARNTPIISIPASISTRSPSVSLPSRTRQHSAVTNADQTNAAKIDARDFAVSQRSSRSRSTPVQDPEVPPQAEPANPPAPRPVAVAVDEPPPSKIIQKEAAFETVFETLETVYDQLINARNGMTVSGTMSRIYSAYKIPNYRNGTTGCHKIPVMEIFHYNAAALLDRLDKSKYEGTGLYAWLKEVAQKKFAPVALKWSEFPYSITLRDSRPRPSSKSFKSLETSAEPQGLPTTRSLSTDTEAPSITPSRVGKTVRRPGRLPGKSSLRLATGGTKRLHSEVDDSSDLEENYVKKFHYVSEVEETMEDTSAPEDDEDEDGELINIVLQAEKLPSMMPHGPNDTWTCDQEGCHHVVRGGDVKECQDRIRQHFEEHEEQQVSRVNLAMTESSRGHIPINHLLDKIKRLGEKAQGEEQKSVNGMVLPKPIKRKLII